MYIPIPILIVIGLIFLLLVGRTIGTWGTRDPLLGDQPPTFRPAARAQPKRAPIVPVATLSPEIEVQIRALIDRGQKIEAIKLARNATHLGLKEAKDLVESFERLPRAN